VVYLAEFKFVQQFVSKLSEVMLEVCPTYTLHRHRRLDDDATSW